MRPVRTTVTGLALASALVATMGAPSAEARSRPKPPPKPVTVASGLLTPLSLAVDSHGTVYTTQNFAGQLLRLGPHGARTTLYTSAGGAEVGGVSVRGSSQVFAVTGATQTVKQRDKWGHVSTLADVGAYEARKNPDGRTHYGIRGLAPSCAAQFPEQVPASYTGIVESHPYATATWGSTTYVADAAGNSVLSIDGRGHVRTVAVLPTRPSVITAEAAAGAGIPTCAVGKTYHFEGVPTDVEVGPGGWLYVTSLPGGPEDASLGARGAVYKINPRTGHVVQIGKNLLGATNLAVTPRGDVYVTELFGNRITLIAKGSHTNRTFLNTVLPGAVEWTPKAVYATTGVLIGADPENPAPPGGAVIKVPTWPHWH
ncbi:ScyD/ScyE family protein [Luteipulveratus mongoliensis]|uniref:ScyD/ScyE family protein n=1 Tax=Luteipulveratus mongoliensis TaxID=571913 RepID=A0A0K1JQH7_9MICO|nr:ScyD/ScyE family protein [Luteipulveratus mongoliensis]AKU18982.1 hypothetical protein VV02_15755 [Luteipulveratus mongoliensis]